MCIDFLKYIYYVNPLPIPTPLHLHCLPTYPHRPRCEYLDIMDLIIIYTHKLKTIKLIYYQINPFKYNIQTFNRIAAIQEKHIF